MVVERNVYVIVHVIRNEIFKRQKRDQKTVKWIQIG